MQLGALMEQMGNSRESQFMSPSGRVEKNGCMVERMVIQE